MAEDVTEKKQKRRIQCAWAGKSKLERNLIVILILTILLFIALLLYVVIKPAVMKRRCISPDCLIAASEIISRISPETDPCQDATKFACAKSVSYLEKNAKQDIERELLEILNEEVSESDHHLLKSEKLLFRSCMEDGDDFGETIVDQISDLDWPVVVGYQWREQNFDWQELVFKLRKRGYPFEMIFQLKVVHEGPAYTVKISPPDLDNITAGIEHYKKYMADVAVLFGAEAKRAENDMEKVFYFAQHLNKISDFHSGSVSTTVRNYLDDNADLDWLNYINNILYPVNQLTLDDYAQFPTKGFTNELHNLIYRTPKRVIANYIIWIAIETLMPLMPRKLREARHTYECHTKSETWTRQELCQQTLKTFLPDPSHIVYARKHLSKICRTKIMKVFHGIRDELIETLNKTSWLDERSRQRSAEILNDMVTIIGMPSDYFNDSIFEKNSWPGYQSKIGENASLLQMALAESYRFTNNQFYRVRQNKKQDTYVPITSTSPSLNLDSNTITFPLGILQERMFSEDRPTYLNYGFLGKAIAIELVRAVVGEEDVVWNETSRNQFYERAKCLHEFNISSNANDTVWEMIGVQIAYSAYKTWRTENSAENQLPGLTYTPEQLFWISSVNCSQASTVLQNILEFGQDFNCPTNPPKTCEIF